MYHQCRFRFNRSTTVQMFCVRQILEKKKDYNGKVHQLTINFEEHDSVIKEVFYTIHTEFGIPIKLIRLTDVLKRNLQ